MIVSFRIALIALLAALVALNVVVRAEAQTQNQPKAMDDSSISLPHAPLGFDAPRDGIPHGTVQAFTYDSKTVGIARHIVVYTPPGYDPHARYPVLYLLPGIGQTETAWTQQAGAQIILDNLYADHKLVPMIVVMANGRASADPPPANPFDGDPFRTYGAFEQDLIRDLIPYIDAHFPVRPDANDRAIAGLSMGGGQTLNIGFRHLDAFGWIAAFSSAPNTLPPDQLVTDPGAARKLRLLWLSCADQDGLMHINHSFHEYLVEKQVPHIWHVDSSGHNWPTWQNDLYLVTPMLFRDPAPADTQSAPPTR